MYEVMAENSINTDSGIHDLRILYNNARKMLQSDDVQVLYNFLVENLVEFTGFERVVLLCMSADRQLLETRIFYGFEDELKQNVKLPMAEVNGLLHKVYMDREPLAVLDFTELSSKGAESGKCAIVRDTGQCGDDQPNRRTRINLCLSCESSRHKYLNGQDPFKYYSIVDMDVRDKTVATLLGDTNSFLILPICDGENFHGYVLIDNGLSGATISYDNIRFASGIVQHTAHALKNAVKKQRLYAQINEQMEEISRLKSFYQNIIQNLRSGLITVDQNMIITEVNNAAGEILGYGLDELVGKPINLLFVDEKQGRQCFYVDMVDNIDANMGTLFEVSMQKKNGKIFPTEVCFSVITDKNDIINGLSCIFRDLTERKALEQDLARKDKLASLGELAAGVAHEIKNPLAGIAGALQILARDFQEESPRQYIFNEVQGQVKRIDSFVNDLLQFAKPGEIKFIVVDVKKIINRTLQLVTSQKRKKNINIKVKFCDNQHHVMGDAGQLQQVFLNIIFNALDTMDEGGELTIEGRTELSPVALGPGKECPNPVCGSPIGTMNIFFVDSGKGIEPHVLESIFNPFHTTKSNGRGLGLSIAARIVEQHGGTIMVESEPGAGSTFSVQLPVCSAAKSEDTSEI